MKEDSFDITILGEHRRGRTQKLSRAGDCTPVLLVDLLDEFDTRSQAECERHYRQELLRRRTLRGYAVTLCLMALIIWPLYITSPLLPYHIAMDESYEAIVTYNQQMLRQ